MPKAAKAKKKVLVLNGPNLNLLGTREPSIYGRETLADIERRLAAKARAGGVGLACFQTNHAGDMVERILIGLLTGGDVLLRLRPAVANPRFSVGRERLTATEVVDHRDLQHVAGVQFPQRDQ